MLRRTPLARKTPLRRGDKPLKRTKPMNKVSTQKRRVQKKSAKLLYCDSFGVAFGDAQKFMRSIPVSRWVELFPIHDKKRPEVLRFMHANAGEPAFDTSGGDWQTFGKCWLCPKDDTQKVLQLHHVISRFDFYGNCLMCCREDHERVQHAPEHLPEVLRALVTHNPFVSWLHLIRCRGSLFPFDSLD